VRQDTGVEQYNAG